jgi:hypothetical protein
LKYLRKQLKTNISPHLFIFHLELCFFTVDDFLKFEI